jgi:hypothetical protein
MNDRQILRKLIAAVLIKLVLLAGIWGAFFDGRSTKVDPDVMASTIVPTPNPSPETGELRNAH